MPPAARITDMHTCPMVTGVVPHVGGPIIKGEPTVMIGYMPAARIGDQVTCVGPPDVIVKGSPTVLIGYMPAARMGDNTAHGGVITVGFPTVMIGESAGGGGGGGGAGGGADGGKTSPESTEDVTSEIGAPAGATDSGTAAATSASASCECSNPACADAFKSAAKDGTPLVDRESPGCAPQDEQAVPEPAEANERRLEQGPADSSDTEQQSDESADTPHWIPIAEGEIGVHEIRGDDHNARVVQYHSTTTLRATTDETPWCSSFVNWVMIEAGYTGTNSARAIDWAGWGQRVSRPAYGAIVVFRWAPAPETRGHVGFVVGKLGNRIQVLGGNQSDQVKVSSYATGQVIAYVFPSDYTVPDDAYDLGPYTGGSDEGSLADTR